MHLPRKSYVYAIFALALSLSVSATPANATVTILGPFPIINVTYGVGTIPLVAPTSNSSAPWVFGSSNEKVAVVSGKSIKVVGTGTSIITASQSAMGSFTARSRSTQIRVSQGTPVLGVFNSRSLPITQRTLVITPPTTTSDGTWSFLSSDPSIASIVDNKVTFQLPGSVLITATQTGTANWKMASSSMKITIIAIAPVLGAFSGITIKKESISSLTLNPPTSSSPAPWTFTSSDPRVASVIANVVAINTPGTTIITATQSAAGDYASATASMKLTLQAPKPTVSPTPNPKPSSSPTVRPSPTVKSSPTSTPKPKPTISPTPTPSATGPVLNSTLKVTADGRVLTVVAIGVNVLVFINGKPGRVGRNPVVPGVASVVITIDDKVVYRRVFSIK